MINRYDGRGEQNYNLAIIIKALPLSIMPADGRAGRSHSQLVISTPWLELRHDGIRMRA